MFSDYPYWIINVFVFSRTRFRFQPPRLGFAGQSAAKTGRTAGLYTTMINRKKNKILRSRKIARRRSHVLCYYRSFPLAPTACAYTIYFYLVAVVLFRAILGPYVEYVPCARKTTFVEIYDVWRNSSFNWWFPLVRSYTNTITDLREPNTMH